MYHYSQTLFHKEGWDAVLLPPWRTGNRTMAHFLDLQAFIVRARVLKLYRQALRTARRAPIHSRDELRQTIRQEIEKNRHCEDRQKIRFLVSEGLQRLKGLDEMLDMMGHG
ncbi:uncharacterized protein [Elaeis guineensis]|uniref:LYR motif-containing protein 2 n=1 Tax=Elaeis guineensis var. tenera TaxID=51953 RepID=A0A6I9R0B9_ELAGV|nr:uncharacterized protein LOC105042564 [Elaeis guineensis]XP_010918148.1 uncharacterized protein LOC105042564 [Elaeis guineensis]